MSVTTNGIDVSSRSAGLGIATTWAAVAFAARYSGNAWEGFVGRWFCRESAADEWIIIRTMPAGDNLAAPHVLAAVCQRKDPAVIDVVRRMYYNEAAKPFAIFQPCTL